MNTNNRHFGTCTHNNDTYEITCDAWIDNKGTNGDVVYIAYATNNNKKYRVTWYVTDEWDKSCELLNLENNLLDSWRDEKDIEQIQSRIDELEAEDVRSSYAEDESNSCDWDVADEVEECE